MRRWARRHPRDGRHSRSGTVGYCVDGPPLPTFDGATASSSRVNSDSSFLGPSPGGCSFLSLLAGFMLCSAVTCSRVEGYESCREYDLFSRM